MRFEFCLAVVAMTLFSVNAMHNPPKVQVYSKSPGYFEKPNKLICHVSEFHPPDISIQLLRNGVEIPNVHQTDLAFEQTWQYHLTSSVDFTPAKDVQYTCRVKHGKDPAKDYNWEPDI